MKFVATAAKDLKTAIITSVLGVESGKRKTTGMKMWQAQQALQMRQVFFSSPKTKEDTSVLLAADTQPLMPHSVVKDADWTFLRQQATTPYLRRRITNMDTFSFMLFAAAFGLGFFAFPLAVALFTKLCAMFNSMMSDEHEPRE